MTGFSRTGGQNNLCSWTWELKSVNGKGLDIRTRFPKGFDHLEVRVREKCISLFQRGHLVINLSLNWIEAEREYEFNERVLTQILKMLPLIAQQFGVSSPPSAYEVLRLPGVLELKEKKIESSEQEGLDQLIMIDFFEGVEILKSVRQIEGGKIRPILIEKLDRIDDLTRQAEGLVGEQAKLIEGRFREALDSFLNKTFEIPQDRLLQELALLITKVDIREELDRLGVHKLAARKLLKSDQSIGRRLDFLCQELNREANTLCSKSSHVDLINLGLEMKVFIDQFREQVQNIE